MTATARETAQARQGGIAMRKLVTGLAGFALAVSVAGVAASPALAQTSLVSVKADRAPVIDGAADAAWERAPAYKVSLDKTVYEPSNGFKGVTKTTVTLRSLYDQDYVYFLARYDDPTQSLARGQWVKQPDGSWKRLANKDSTGHENTYYEDKFAFIWNINTATFETKGCAAACHKARGGKLAGVEDKAPGRMYTNKPGETLDMWHWKGVRTNPVGQIDDQYIDDTKDPTKNENWGRKNDAKTGGGYVDNVNKDQTGPMVMSKTAGPDSKYWIMAADKIEFVDTFKPGDIVPSMIVEPFTGSRADIEARGVWKDGVWTIEIKRKRVTTGDKAREQDVQFDDLKKTYYFGVAVFDNTQINHVYHEAVHKLIFK
jgi:hypothetical protein